MSENELNKFGKLIVCDVRDKSLEYLFERYGFNRGEKYRTKMLYSKIKNMSDAQKICMNLLAYEAVDLTISHFLVAAESNYDGLELVDKNQIEFLKLCDFIGVENTDPGGWNERFSKFKNMEFDI